MPYAYGRKPLRKIRGITERPNPKSKNLRSMVRSIHVFEQLGHWHVMGMGGNIPNKKFEDAETAVEFIKGQSALLEPITTKKYSIIVHHRHGKKEHFSVYR